MGIYGVMKVKDKKPKKSNKKDKIDNKKNRFLKALSEHCGNISKACEQVKIKSRQTVYKWIEVDEKFKEKFEQVNESEIDNVEDKLKERINGVQQFKGLDKDGKEIVYNIPPDTTAIIFYLKTKAKKRGYIEKTEIETTTKHDFSKASDSDIDEEIKKYE